MKKEWRENVAIGYFFKRAETDASKNHQKFFLWKILLKMETNSLFWLVY